MEPIFIIGIILGLVILLFLFRFSSEAFKVDWHHSC